MSALSGTFLDPILVPFSYSFVHRALLAASVMAIVAGLLSCWLILVGWSLLGDAVSHAVLPGVVLAYVAGLPLIVGAFAAGFGSAISLRQHFAAALRTSPSAYRRGFRESAVRA